MISQMLSKSLIFLVLVNNCVALSEGDVEDIVDSFEDSEVKAAIIDMRARNQHLPTACKKDTCKTISINSHYDLQQPVVFPSTQVGFRRYALCPLYVEDPNLPRMDKELVALDCILESTANDTPSWNFLTLNARNCSRNIVDYLLEEIGTQMVNIDKKNSSWFDKTFSFLFATITKYQHMVAPHSDKLVKVLFVLTDYWSRMRLENIMSARAPAPLEDVQKIFDVLDYATESTSTQEPVLVAGILSTTNRLVAFLQIPSSSNLTLASFRTKCSAALFWYSKVSDIRGLDTEFDGVNYSFPTNLLGLNREYRDDEGIVVQFARYDLALFIVESTFYQVSQSGEVLRQLYLHNFNTFSASVQFLGVMDPVERLNRVLSFYEMRLPEIQFTKMEFSLCFKVQLPEVFTTINSYYVPPSTWISEEGQMNLSALPGECSLSTLGFFSSIPFMSIGRDKTLDYSVTYLEEFLGFPFRFDLYHLSHVCRALSFASLLIMIITISISRDRHKQPQQILMHLGASLLCLLLILYLTEYLARTDNGCTAMNILRFYFILVALMWNGIEAHSMHLNLIKVIITKSENFIKVTATMAWCLPGIVVAVVIAIDQNGFDGYHVLCIFRCILKPDVLHYALLVPLGVVMLHNTIICCLVIKVIYVRRKFAVNNSTENPEFDWGHVRSALVVMLLLGLPWIFGIFGAIDKLPDVASHVIEIITVLMINLQGFFIFLLQCVGIKDRRQLWLTTFSSILSRLGQSSSDTNANSSEPNVEAGNDAAAVNPVDNVQGSGLSKLETVKN